MIRRLCASNPDFATFDELWTLNAIARNPCMYPFNEMDLPPAEYAAFLEILEAKMDALLNDLLPRLAEVVEGIEHAE